MRKRRNRERQKPSNKTNSKWQRFEALVAKIQQDIAPDAQVTLNDKIRGRRSKVLRQIDISVRRAIGQYEILIVIDCKDYSHPVDVKDVEEFLGLVDDVGANKGALVSSSGFSEAARTRAHDAGVDVYRLVDAENEDWRSYVAIPFICDFRGFGKIKFLIGGSIAILKELAQQDSKLISVYDQSHILIGTPLTLLQAMWHRMEISDQPGIRETSIEPNPVLVQAQDGHFEHVGITARFEIIQRLYFGELPITKITGFRDETTGNIILPNKAEVVFDTIDFGEVERSWLRIASEDVLAVRPVMTLMALDYYPSTPLSNSDSLKYDETL